MPTSSARNTSAGSSATASAPGGAGPLPMGSTVRATGARHRRVTGGDPG